MKFILSRTDDYRTHSKKWIVGYGLLFWLISRIVSMCLMVGCSAIYDSFGIDPAALTKFTGDPQTAKTLGSMAYVLFTVCLMAPLLEECIFRLGLSFKRWQVAVAAASIPAYMLWQKMGSLTITSGAIYVAAIAGAFAIVYCLTSDGLWQEYKRMYLRPMMWLSAIAFGLIHLIAFSNYSLVLLPYMLCVISVPFFAGCAMTYYRVNLGFWWGVGLHIFNNLPAVCLLLAS